MNGEGPSNERPSDTETVHNPPTNNCGRRRGTIVFLDGKSMLQQHGSVGASGELTEEGPSRRRPGGVELNGVICSLKRGYVRPRQGTAHRKLGGNASLKAYSLWRQFLASTASVGAQPGGYNMEKPIILGPLRGQPGPHGAA